MDAFATLAKQGRVIAFRFKGKKIDCSNVKGVVDAINYFFEVD
jgi:UTP--glucose-1-phosphate uridylyltransferase